MTDTGSDAPARRERESAGDTPSQPNPSSADITTLAPPHESLGTDQVLARCATVQLGGVAYPALGRYLILRRLGDGGMGSVYQAFDSALARMVAVKLLRTVSTDMTQRFSREAQIAAQLKSRHLVAVFNMEVDQRSGHGFVVMELIDGPTARAWQREHADSRGVREEEALQVCIAATLGLVHAHGVNVVHRDIKPANILIPHKPDRSLDLDGAKLADMGLARSWSVNPTRIDGLLPAELVSPVPGLTSVGTFLGTLGYVPPEQASDARSVGPQADVFGMGATLYSLLTGVPPTPGRGTAEQLANALRGRVVPIHHRRANLDSATVSFVGQCLSADVSDRPHNAFALLDGLRTCLRTVRVRDHPGELIDDLIFDYEPVPFVGAAPTAAELAEATDFVNERERDADLVQTWRGTKPARLSATEPPPLESAAAPDGRGPQVKPTAAKGNLLGHVLLLFATVGMAWFVWTLARMALG